MYFSKQPLQTYTGIVVGRMGANKRRFAVGLVSAILLLYCSISVIASDNAVPKNQTKTPEEMAYETKAMYLFNFMRFIDWPEERLITDRQYEKENTPPAEKEERPPIIIGIWGHDPFGQAFEPVLDKKINNRAILLVQFESFHAYRNTAKSESDALTAYTQKYATLLNQCDVLFVCTSETDCLEQLLPLTAHGTAVTISDIPDFVLHGGMIGFVTESNKIRFEINLDNAKKQNIKIRSQLLELARKVHKSKMLKSRHNTMSLQ